MSASRVLCPLLFIALFISTLFFSTNTKNNSELSRIIDSRDSKRFGELTKTRHAIVRREIDSLLTQYILAHESRKGHETDSLAWGLEWAVMQYENSTGLKDLCRKWAMYSGWDWKAVSTRGSLDRALDSLYSLENAMSSTRKIDSFNVLRNQYRLLADSFRQAEVTYSIAQEFLTAGLIDSAITNQCITASICDSIEYYPTLAACQLVLGRIYNSNYSNYALSEQAYSRAARLYQILDEPDKAFYAGLGRVYNLIQLYRNQQVIEAIHEMLPEAKKLGHEALIGDLYNFLAEAFLNEAMYDSSRYYSQTAILHLPYYKQGYAYSTLGLLNHIQHNEDSSSYNFRIAEKIFSETNDSEGFQMNAVRYASHCLASRQIDRADSLYGLILEQSQNYENIIFALKGLALIDYYRGNPGEARQKLASSIRLIENIYQGVAANEASAGVLSDKVSCYTTLGFIYLKEHETHPTAGFIDSALISIENGRCRFLLEGMHSGPEQANPLLENLYIRLSQVQKFFYLPHSNVDSLAAVLKGLEDSIYICQIQENTRGKNGRSPTETRFSIDNLRRALKSTDAILIEYVMSDLGCYYLVVSDTGIKFHFLQVSQESLASLAKQYLTEISHPPGSSYSNARERSTSGQLYEQLVSPVIESYGTGHKLVFITDGILNYLPFETLIDENDRYLIESCEVSYAPSAGAYAVLEDRAVLSDNHDEVVVIGYSPDNQAIPTPTGDRSSEKIFSLSAIGSLAALPFCSTEVNYIRSLFTDRQVRLLWGTKANEDGIKKYDFSRTSILHIAAHGIADDKYPSRSAIVVAGDTENDGLLQPHEIMNLTIPVELVFLSSCQSGGGRSFPGEGVMSLARPFLEAGSQSIIATYWNISDRSAAVFIKKFYQFIRQGLPSTIALAQTKRDFIQSDIELYRHPYYWAPFTYIGR